MHYGVRSTNVVSYNGEFSATIKEEQAICRMFDHRQSNPYVAALALCTLWNDVMQRRQYRSALVPEIGNPI